MRKTSKLYFINITILAFAAVLIFAYVYFSNRLVADRYLLTLLHKQLNQLGVNLELKNSEIENRYSPEFLAAFARSRGLVEAKDFESIFDEGSFVLSKFKIQP